MTQDYQPHMACTKKPNGRWVCSDCGFEADSPNEIIYVDGCTKVHPPCKSCGQTPICAPDCSGIAEALGADHVRVIASPKRGR
jgi:hypothetical protein